MTSSASAGKPTESKFTLTVVHNNDGESDLLPSEQDADPGAGSISRFGSVVEQLRREALTGPTKSKSKTGVITITSGDNFLASPELQASFDKGVPWYDTIALDAIDYDAFVIGNHEFDFGPDVLANFIEGFEGGDDVFLSANLDFSNEPSLQALVDEGRIAKSTVIKERGERIGIVGATTPELNEVTSPGDVIVDPDVAGAVQAEVDALTAQGVEIILVSSHLQDINNELDLVTELTDVDAIIGGGGGEDIANNYPLTAEDADGVIVPVVTVPGDYFDVGRLVLDFDKDGNVIGFGGGLVPVTSEAPQDPFLLANVEKPVADYLAELGQDIIATSEVGLNGVRVDVRSRETNVGNLMTDGMLAAATARAGEFGAPLPDVALQNGGGIRNDSVIGPGEISMLDTFDIASFANFVAVLDPVSTADFVAAVEHGLSGLPNAAGPFAQWGGLTVTYDPTATAGSRVIDLVLDDGTTVVEDGGIVSVDPVVVATIDFLAGGNDGYDMFESYDFTQIGISYQQSLAVYIESLGTITASDYADPVNIGERTRIIPV
ncbi:bifunctional metallophosphatase/5'-nucleotidase [Ilumatobacter sp.]|uniref:bifunctional metallophosphatase/5'-nucleotidase n=1 Tax=Ilumatobacter sp. TaxID=1967498 RepID=UPI003C350017